MISSTHSLMQTQGIPSDSKNERSPRDKSSEGFEGDGTLAYQGNADELASTLSSASSIRLAAWFLALPEMATSLEELLSTKNTTE